MARLVDITDFTQLENGQQIMIYSPKSGTWVELHFDEGSWDVQCGDVQVSLEPDGRVETLEGTKIAEVEK